MVRWRHRSRVTLSQCHVFPVTRVNFPRPFLREMFGQNKFATIRSPVLLFKSPQRKPLTRGSVDGGPGLRVFHFLLPHRCGLRVVSNNEDV